MTRGITGTGSSSRPLGMQLRRLAGLLAAHTVLGIAAAFILLPFVWMLLTSIRPPAEIFEASFRLWPRDFHGVENYTRALTTAPLLRFMLNGAIVCIGILVVQLLVAIPAMMFYRYFNRRVEGFVVTMELEALKLVEVLHGERPVDGEPDAAPGGAH